MIDLKKILKQLAAVQKSDTLTTWEKDFVKGIADRAEKWGDTLHISDKQAAIIDKIFSERVQGNRVESTPSNPFPASDNVPD